MNLYHLAASFQSHSSQKDEATNKQIMYPIALSVKFTRNLLAKKSCGRFKVAVEEIHTVGFKDPSACNLDFDGK